MNTNKTPVILRKAAINRIGNECVILPNDLTEDCIVGLANETAIFIIDQIDGEKTVDEIADRVFETYEIDKKTALMAVMEFVSSLIEQGVCQWKEK